MTTEFLAGSEPSAKVVTELERKLRADETPLFGARSSGFRYGLKEFNTVNLLVTSRRLLVSKERLMGGAKVDAEIDLSAVTSTGFGPLYGTGPTWEMHFRDRNNNPGIMYFPDEARAGIFNERVKGACEALYG